MRYPFSALVAATGYSKSDLEVQLGLRYEQLRHLEDVGLTEEQADHFAIQLGYHPGNIWNEWWNIPLISEAEMDLMERPKMCRACKVEHPMTAFSLQTRSLDGHNGICKRVISERNKRYRGTKQQRELLAA